MHHVQLYRHDDVSWDCHAELNPSTLQHVAFVLLVILPFLCGTTAFLRALIDALPVRWHTGLHYKRGFECWGEGCAWWACLPVTGVFMSVRVMLGGVWLGLRWVVEAIMGRGRQEGEIEIEIEMRDEEQGLVGGMEGGKEDGESYGLPAYEEVGSLLKG
jgi:hypothetical protein